jgi:spore coat-associated protein N
VVGVLAGLTALYAILASPGTTAGRSASPAIALASGSLSQSNSKDGSAILAASNMKPGDLVSGTVTIENTGSIGGAFSLSHSNLLDTAGPNGGALSAKLDLLVEDVTAPGFPATVYSGRLDGLGTRALGSFSPGRPHIYRFKVSFPDGGSPPSQTGGDNAYQGSAVSVQYDWSASEAPTAEPPPQLAPPPSAARNLEPDSNVKKIRKRVRARKLRRFEGTASDDVEVAKVEIALLRLEGKARAAAGKRRRTACFWLKNGKARFKRTGARRRKCGKQLWLRARGTTSWRFKLSRPLPRGTYVLYSRATDNAGLSEQRFTSGDRNRIRFRVR